MAPSSSAVSNVNRRNVVRIVKTPASIEHDGVEYGSAERDRRLQKESWPAGQARKFANLNVVGGFRSAGIKHHDLVAEEHRHECVKFHDILYTFWRASSGSGFISHQRSTYVDRWCGRASSRAKLRKYYTSMRAST